MSENNFTPSLSNLIPLNLIPENFKNIDNGIQDLLNNFFFTNLLRNKSLKGDRGWYRLSVIAYTEIGINFPNTDFKLILNPTFNQSSTTGSIFDVNFDYYIPILGLIEDVENINLDGTAVSLFNVLLEIFEIDIEDFISELVKTFSDQTDSISEFVDLYNSRNTSNLINPISGDFEDVLIDLIQKVVSGREFLVVFQELYDTFIFDLNVEELFSNLSKVFEKWIGSYDLTKITDLLNVQFSFTVDNISIGLKFPPNYLRLIDPQSNHPQVDTTGNEIGSILSFKVGALAYSTSFGFKTTKENTFSLPLSEVAKSGFLISFNGLRIDLKDNKNIPEADADDRPVTFKGIYADEAVIDFPKFFNTNAKLTGTNILIGTEGGFSGKIKLELEKAVPGGSANTPISANLFGLELSLMSFELDFKKNDVVGFEIVGSMKIKDLILDIIGETTPGGYRISAQPNSTSSNRIKIVKGIDLIIRKVSIQRDNRDESFTLGVSCFLDIDKTELPMVGKYLPDEIDLKDLDFNSKGGLQKLDLAMSWTSGNSELEVSSVLNEVRIDYKLNFPQKSKDVKTNPTNPNSTNTETKDPDTKDNPDLLFFALSAIFKLNQGAGTDFTLALSGKLPIGFGTAKFKEFGVKTTLVFVESGGDIGPLKFESTAIKLPNSIEIIVDKGGIKGGGILNINQEKGEFSGALSLSFKKFTLSAFGILNTKLPSGEKGMSLLILVSTTFTTGVPVGFGFTLNGVGGILGINRVMNTDELRKSLSTGAVKTILFPENPEKQFDEILGKLQTFFPVYPSRHVLGFMLRLNYSKFLIADLGLALEIPSPIRAVVLGSIRVLLPEPDKAKVNLRVDFLGTIEFNPLIIYFDAALVDSRIINYTLTGDLALRLITGREPYFLVTAGGFHPAFKVPAYKLENVKRLVLGMNGSDNLTISTKMYVAVTSNSAQFGASVAILAKFDNITAKGNTSFDALFYFKPFEFKFSAELDFAVSYKSRELIVLKAVFNLTGPSPWNTNGKVTGKVLGIEFDVSFNATWGGSKVTVALPDVSVLPILKEALMDKKNWTSIRNDSDEFVQIKSFENTSEIILGPGGKFGVNQEKVPFNLSITKYGGGRVTDVTKQFKITRVIVGNIPVTDYTYTKDNFAISQFMDLSEKDQLQRPSFEKFDNGIIVSSINDTISNGTSAHQGFSYEKIILDEDKRILIKNVALDATSVTQLMMNGSGSNNAYSKSKQPAEAAIKMQPESYSVVSTIDLTKITPENFNSYVEAQEFITTFINTYPTTTNREIIVINNNEL